MYGQMIGYLMLDERDENVIAVISVTPPRETGFIIYRKKFNSRVG